MECLAYPLPPFPPSPLPVLCLLCSSFPCTPPFPSSPPLPSLPLLCIFPLSRKFTFRLPQPCPLPSVQCALLLAGNAARAKPFSLLTPLHQHMPSVSSHYNTETQASVLLPREALTLNAECLWPLADTLRGRSRPGPMPPGTGPGRGACGHPSCAPECSCLPWRLSSLAAPANQCFPKTRPG